MASLIARRVKNAPKGSMYGIDSVECETQEAAEECCAAWWKSGGTIAMAIIKEDGSVDSHYMRPYADKDRLPKGWQAYYKPAPKIPTAALQPNPPPERAIPPSLFNEGEVEVQSPDRTMTLTKCGCCGNPRPIGGFEESDPTPSGRIADGRCMQCGRPLPGIPSRVINNLYMSFIEAGGS